MDLSSSFHQHQREGISPVTVHTPSQPQNPQPPVHPSFTLSQTPHSFYTVVPDKDRKKPNRLSAKQKQSRRDNEAIVSRILNLTLDINALRQELQYLEACRDLRVTRMLLDSQRMEIDALAAADMFLFGANAGRTAYSGRFSFSGVLVDLLASEAPDGVYIFEIQLDKSSSNHHSGEFTTTQVLSIVGENSSADTVEDAKVRRVCGDLGGCVVEAFGCLAGRLSREAIISMFPLIVGDEMVVNRLIGVTITSPVRLLLYVDARYRVVRQIAHIEVLSALNEVQQAMPAEFGAITSSAYPV